MKKQVSTSLLISTYNRPDALELSLLSVLQQDVMPDEIIIADDGSGASTKDLIEQVRPRFNIPLFHVWQADEGFQLSKIRNKAIAKSTKEYIIQIDGDVILHERFVSDHIAFAQEGTFVTGSRVLMNEALTNKVLRNRLVKLSPFSKGIKNLTNGLRIRLLRSFFGRRYKSKDVFYMRGCNMAFWRKDLIAVNGYNEEFVGWGREDSEIAVRLINIGLRKRTLKFGGIVFHIHHPEFDRGALSDNDAILTYALANKISRCKKGVNQYLENVN